VHSGTRPITAPINSILFGRERTFTPRDSLKQKEICFSITVGLSRQPVRVPNGRSRVELEARMAIDAFPSPASQPFTNWKRATTELRSAEARAATHAELVHLSEEVIRTRNLLTADWAEAGLELPADVARQLASDTALLEQPDDTSYPGLT